MKASPTQIIVLITAILMGPFGIGATVYALAPASEFPGGDDTDEVAKVASRKVGIEKKTSQPMVGKSQQRRNVITIRRGGVTPITPATPNTDNPLRKTAVKRQ